MHILTHLFLTQPCEVGTIIIPIFTDEEMRAQRGLVTDPRWPSRRCPRCPFTLLIPRSHQTCCIHTRSSVWCPAHPIPFAWKAIPSKPRYCPNPPYPSWPGAHATASGEPLLIARSWSQSPHPENAENFNCPLQQVPCSTPYPNDLRAPCTLKRIRQALHGTMHVWFTSALPHQLAHASAQSHDSRCRIYHVLEKCLNEYVQRRYVTSRMKALCYKLQLDSLDMVNAYF